MKNPLKYIRNILIAAVAVVLVVFLVAQIISMREKNKALEEKKKQLEELIAAEQERAEELENEEDYIKTIEYIEERARAIGYVYPDEIIFRKDEQ